MRGHIRPARKKDRTKNWKNNKSSIDKWEIIVSAGKDPITGKYKSDSLTINGSYTDAETELTRLLREQDMGLRISNPNITLAAFIDLWISDHVNLLRVKTQKFYISMSHNHIVPNIGHIKLNRLQTLQVQKFINELTKRVNPTTVSGVYRTLRAALGKAVEWQYLAHNPASKITLPEEEEKEYTVLNSQQAIELLRQAQDYPLPELYEICLLTLHTGLRLGEVCALRWKDIDFDYKIIYVRQTLTKAGVNPIFGPVKQKKRSKRKATNIAIRLNPILEKELLAIKEKRGEQKKREDYRDYDLVVCHPNGAPIDTDNFRERVWYRFLASTTLPEEIKNSLRIHDLRHSVANVLLSLGVPIEVISSILRHSRIQVTDDFYLHPDVSIQDEAMKKLSETFKEAAVTTQ